MILIVFFYYLSIYEISLSIALALLAIPLGMKISENPEFFYRNQVLFFKRSVLLTIIWLGGFIVRVFLEIFYSTTNITADFVVTALLTFTLGLIIGERIIIYRKGKNIILTGKIEAEGEIKSSS
ncbi:MAG: hypothetical protein QXP70_00400 [Methanomassiliicoccales archaeon]